MDELLEQVVSSQDDQSKKLAGLIANISLSQPLLIMVDDAHLADPASIEVLLYLKKHYQQSQVTILLALRSCYQRGLDQGLEQGVSSSLDSLLLMKKAFDFDLDELEERERRNFVNAIIDIEPNTLDDSFREQLFLRTDGHPLMTKELLKSLVANGTLTKADNDHWQVSGPINWGQAPSDLIHALENRVQSFSEEELELLRLASAFDGEIILPIIAKFLNRSEWSIVKVFTRHLQNSLSIVRETRALRIGDEIYIGFRFREPLLREYLYQQLGTGEKMYIHDAISMGLRNIFHDNIQSVSSELFWHNHKAGRQHEAIDLALEAVGSAMKLGALSEALMHIQLGLNVLDGIHEGDEKDALELNFLLLKGKALRAKEGWSSATLDQLNLRVNELAKRVGKASTMASVWVAEWSSQLMRAQIRASIAPAKQLLESGEKLNDNLSILSGHGILSNSLFWVGEVADAYEHALATIELQRPEYSDNLIDRMGFNPICLGNMFSLWSCYLLGRFEQLATLRQHTQATTTHPHAFTAVMAKMTLVWQASHEQDYQSTIELASSMRDFALNHEFSAYVGLADIFIGWGQAKLSPDPQPGLAKLKAGFDVWCTSSGALISTYLGLLLSDIYYDIQDYDAAHKELDLAFEHLAACDENAYAPELWLMRGNLLQHAPRANMNAEGAYKEGLHLARAGQQRIVELKLLARLKACSSNEFNHAVQGENFQFAEGVLHQKIGEPALNAAKQLLALAN